MRNSDLVGTLEQKKKENVTLSSSEVRGEGKRGERRGEQQTPPSIPISSSPKMIPSHLPISCYPSHPPRPSLPPPPSHLQKRPPLLITISPSFPFSPSQLLTTLQLSTYTYPSPHLPHSSLHNLHPFPLPTCTSAHLQTHYSSYLSTHFPICPQTSILQPSIHLHISPSHPPLLVLAPGGD